MPETFARKRDRAVSLMKLAAKVLRERCKDAPVTYDGRVRTAEVLAADLEAAAEVLDEVTIYRDQRE